MLTSSIFIAEVGEAPDVGKVNSEPDDGKEEVEVAAPCLPLLLACGEHPGWAALHRILSLAALRKVLRGLPQPVGILETRNKKNLQHETSPRDFCQHSISLLAFFF